MGLRSSSTEWGALPAVRVVAALYRHFVLKNDVLMRMTSGV